MQQYLRPKMIINFLILLALVTKAANPFIIQVEKLEKKGKEIVLYSDFHLPELTKSKIKQKAQNKKIKNVLKNSKNLTVLFEGYKQDQKNRFTTQQIQRSKHLTTPAYLDILTQALSNKDVKLIPCDPRKKINDAFLNTIKAIDILSQNQIEDVIQGTAKIKKLNMYKKIQLQQLEKSCPTFEQIFNDINKTRNSFYQKTMENVYGEKYGSIIKKPVASIVSKILRKHYTLVEKPYLDKLKIVTNNLFSIYEESCDLFVSKLLSKIKKSKNNKILVVTGQEHIEKLKKELLNIGYKIKNEIYDNQTIKFVQNLEDKLEDGNLTDINKQLEEKSDVLKIPDEAFQTI